MTHKQEILQMVQEVVSKHLETGTYQLFLIGSQAGRQELKRADIDIAIDAGEKMEGATLAKIQGDLEDLPTLYFFDVVDLHRTDEDFKEIALEKAEQL
jgi:predicted nucleotidyltransferase